MQTLTTLGVSMGFTNNHKHPSPISCCVSGWQALISTTWILSSWFLRASMPSENSRDVWFVGTEGQDGVWSMHLVKDGHCRGTPARWTGPTSVDADTSQPPSGRVRLPCTWAFLLNHLDMQPEVESLWDRSCCLSVGTESSFFVCLFFNSLFM